MFFWGWDGDGLVSKVYLDIFRRKSGNIVSDWADALHEFMDAIIASINNHYVRIIFLLFSQCCEDGYNMQINTFMIAFSLKLK